jgi:hypothetical protein
MFTVSELNIIYKKTCISVSKYILEIFIYTYKVNGIRWDIIYFCSFQDLGSILKLSFYNARPQGHSSAWWSTHISLARASRRLSQLFYPMVFLKKAAVRSLSPVVQISRVKGREFLNCQWNTLPLTCLSDLILKVPEKNLIVVRTFAKMLAKKSRIFHFN